MHQRDARAAEPVALDVLERVGRVPQDQLLRVAVAALHLKAEPVVRSANDVHFFRRERRDDAFRSMDEEVVLNRSVPIALGPMGSKRSEATHIVGERRARAIVLSAAPALRHGCPQGQRPHRAKREQAALHALSNGIAWASCTNRLSRISSSACRSSPNTPRECP